MADRRYDIVIIGGGIHGVGVAQAAAAGGYKVLLLEQTALAHGTSSRSSKLIHGGLRYLEGAHFGLVRECLYERSLLLRLAPELVRLKPFYIPVYPQTRRRPWQLRLGLSLYAVLGGFGTDSRFHSVPQCDWEHLDGLSTQDLQQVFCYYDAQTDDAALTRAVMASAQSLGAELQIPAQFKHAALGAHEVVIEYDYHGQAQSCIARVLVNAAGPWVNHILDLITPEPTRQAIELIQGSHLVLPGTLSAGLYYVEAPSDHRAVFVMPWQNQIMVGTTERPYQGDPAQVQPKPEEIEYLLTTLGHYFPRYASLGAEAVTRSFAGLRVLPAASGSAFGRSRETILHADRPHAPRLLTIYGGKLTAYRATAEKVLQRLHASLPARSARVSTRSLRLQPQ